MAIFLASVFGFLILCIMLIALLYGYLPAISELKKQSKKIDKIYLIYPSEGNGTSVNKEKDIKILPIPHLETKDGSTVTTAEILRKHENIGDMIVITHCLVSMADDVEAYVVRYGGFTAITTLLCSMIIAMFAVDEAEKIKNSPDFYIVL